MNAHELAIAAETFRRMREAVSRLNLTDFLLLKSAYAGLVGFERLSEPIKQAFADVGRASEVVK
jgi:hypothetical protein